MQGVPPELQWQQRTDLIRPALEHSSPKLGSGWTAVWEDRWVLIIPQHCWVHTSGLLEGLEVIGLREQVPGLVNLLCRDALDSLPYQLPDDLTPPLGQQFLMECHSRCLPLALEPGCRKKS